VYLCLKGALKLYYKQRQYLRQAHREIKNFKNENESSNEVENQNREGTNLRS
jgi:hypothetical protein